MNNSTLKTRFCPSPTGLLHLGNVRTALFNALYAQGQSGNFLLRIEDSDKTRSTEDYTKALQEDLLWLGLSWSEGPGCEKDAGPYWQSQRQSIYDHYYDQLEKHNLAYPCFCTEQQLALARKVQLASGKPPRYKGTCRNLTPQQIQEKIDQGLKPTLRFKIPSNEVTIFKDLVRGEQSFDNNDIGDFIIRRADGTPPFMYCNAIDDALMKVTHALRGEDHLTNTPRQIMILKALSLPVPIYGHINLIVGDDGAPLSKRHGSRSLQTLREEGYIPLAIVNYLSRLGHHYAEDQWMTFEQLAVNFSISALGSAPSRFDPHQLLHWQHETILQMDIQALWEWMGQAVHDLVPKDKQIIFVQIIRPNITFPKDALHWAQIFFEHTLEYSEEQQKILREAGPHFFEIAISALKTHNFDFEKIMSVLKDTLNIKGKALFQPLRVALTGESHGPELLQIFELLGREGVVKRFEKALEECQACLRTT